MVLQDLAPCCVVLGPIGNLRQDNKCQHDTNVIQGNTDRQTTMSTALSQAFTQELRVSQSNQHKLSFGRPPEISNAAA